MIIVRSSFDINHFTCYFGGIGVYNFSVSNGIVVIGSAKLLAKLAGSYDLPRDMKYMVADYGDYVFINRVVNRRNEGVNEELDLLRKGLRYDVILKKRHDLPINLEYVASVPTLDINPHCYPYLVMVELDRMFTTNRTKSANY